MRSAVWIVGTCVVAAVALNAQDRSASAQSSQPDAVAANHATVQKYCVSCHNEKVKSGGLTLSTLDLARVTGNADVMPEPLLTVREDEIGGRIVALYTPPSRRRWFR